MNTFNFTLIASGLDPKAVDLEDRLFEAGCGDATVSFQRGVLALEFEREARTFVSALISAIVDLRKTGAQVIHIEPDYLVSLSEIADRSQFTRAAISHFASGTRGRDFPRPVARLASESPLWDWLDVARWMYHSKGRLNLRTVVKAKILREANRTVQEAIQPSDRSIFVTVMQSRLSDQGSNGRAHA